MRELTLREVQQIQLGLLDEVSAFCAAEKIEYLVVGGALLGAVRNGSFIPWDDDIDLFMLRADYDRFVERYGETGNLQLASYNTMEGYYYPFVKVFDPKTSFRENVDRLDMRPMEGLGVGIDIFPIDYVPRDEVDRQRVFRKWHRIVGTCYDRYVFFKPHQSGVYKLLCNLIAAKDGLGNAGVPEFLAKAESVYREQDESELVCDSWTDCCFEKKWLTPSTKIEFEGRMVPVPGDYVAFLTHVYGDDYMTPRNDAPDGHGKAYLL